LREEEPCFIKEKNMIMLANYFKIGFLLMWMFCFVACEKNTGIEPVDECQRSCAMVPETIIDPNILGRVVTLDECKYYFNLSTGQCEIYLYMDGSIPFETLQECELCGCDN
jgi:hypothetical protein